jgi:hypothetical protein
MAFTSRMTREVSKLTAMVIGLSGTGSITGEQMTRLGFGRAAYCAEQFENDGSPVSTVVKGVKRAMVGENSRELSAKVHTQFLTLI